MRSDYKICPLCGAALDIGERCDCTEEERQIIRRTQEAYRSAGKSQDSPTERRKQGKAIKHPRKRKSGLNRLIRACTHMYIDMCI